MVDIVVDPKAFSQSKVHPMIIERARKKMLKTPDPKRPRAKRKWQEIVYLEEGIRLAMNCHKSDDTIVITGIKKLKKQKPVGPPGRRRR